MERIDDEKSQNSPRATTFSQTRKEVVADASGSDFFANRCFDAFCTNLTSSSVLVLAVLKILPR